MSDTRRIGPGRYLLDGARVPSVTTVLQTLAKPALVPWAAKLTATLAVDSLDSWQSMSRDDAISFLKNAPHRDRSRAALRGTDIHRHAEALVNGHADDVPDELIPYVESCARFLDSWDIEPLLIETPVFSRTHGYAGEPDLFAVSDRFGEPWLFDYKTGSGIYAETALQLTAYRCADFYVDEHDDEIPVPDVVGCAAVHLREGGYSIRQVTAGALQRDCFLSLLNVYRTWVDSDLWVLPERVELSG